MLAKVKYVIVIKTGPDKKYEIRYPDFPELVSTTDKIKNTKTVCKDVIENHLQELLDMGKEIPTPLTGVDVAKTLQKGEFMDIITVDNFLEEVEEELDENLPFDDEEKFEDEEMEEPSTAEGYQEPTEYMNTQSENSGRGISQDINSGRMAEKSYSGGYTPNENLGAPTPGSLPNAARLEEAITGISSAGGPGILRVLVGILFIASVFLPVMSLNPPGAIVQKMSFFNFGGPIIEGMGIIPFKIKSFLLFGDVLIVFAGIFSLYAGLVKRNVYPKASNVIAILLCIGSIVAFKLGVNQYAGEISNIVKMSYFFTALIAGAILAFVDFILIKGRQKRG